MVKAKTAATSTARPMMGRSISRRIWAGDAPITAALSRRQLTVFGDGLQTRDFVFVKDVVSANISAAQGNAGGAFNIGSGRQTSVIELASLVLKLTGHDMDPIYRPPQPGDIRHSFADISRAAEFGYSPRHSLEEGMKRTIASFTTPKS